MYKMGQALMRIDIFSKETFFGPRLLSEELKTILPTRPFTNILHEIWLFVTRFKAVYKKYIQIENCSIY